MKTLKMNRNTRPDEMPPGEYPYGKNGVQHDLPGAWFNEPGFELMAAVTPYTIMGVVESDIKPIIFSGDGLNSAIGYFNPESGAYELRVCDDPTNLVNWPNSGERLGFLPTRYITGEAQRNYKGEVVVAFTDKDKFPKYVNMDTPNISRLSDLRLFPFFKEPRASVEVVSGGILQPGTYYIVANYEKNDGTISPRTGVLAMVTARPNQLLGVTDAALEITLTNVDTAYDFIRLTIISKVEGKTSAVQLTDLAPVGGGSATIAYTGYNLSEEVSLVEVLTPAVVYDKIGCFGQLNDVLYAGNLHQEQDMDDLQQYALLAKLHWKSELINVTNPPAEHVSGAKRSILHEEVGAWYIRFKKTAGGFSKCFHVAGPEMDATFLNTSSEPAMASDSGSAPRFKVEDCITTWSGSTGEFGPYYNDNEKYPNHPYFDASAIGGLDLRNQPVRHHKAPSLRWCKANLYSGDDRYGVTHLDLLGIYATNIQIPAKYTGQIDGYELLYAKRSGGNMTIHGQGMLLHPLSQTDDGSVSTYDANLYTSGGNWRSGILHQGSGSYNDGWELQYFHGHAFRFHSFDILFNKPAVAPRYFSGQYRLHKGDLRNSDTYVEDGDLGNGPGYDAPQTLIVDYTKGVYDTSVDAGQYLKKVRESFHLAMGTTVSRLNNINHESCFAGTLELSQPGNEWDLSVSEILYRIRGQQYTEQDKAPDYEQGFIANLLSLRDDIYAPFYTQQLVSAGQYKALNDSTPFWGGDTFLADYSFHTYGRHDSVDTFGDGIRGIKVVRRIICESAANLHLRYEIPGNNYSKWYPRTSMQSDNVSNYLTQFQRSIEPNQFGYTRDLNAVNDFVSSTIYNPYLEVLLDYPYRIHRLGKVSRQNKFRSWRTALPLDYYECQKDRGPIVNLCGLYDRLIIHHTNAVFRTQDKAKLDSGALSVTLGSGDIFQFEPQEGIPSKLGYAGTQHDLACVKTPLGYVFPDARTGELFVLGSDGVQSLGGGLNNFFREFLTMPDRNPFIGDGITIGWDTYYKRILVTVKNLRGTPGAAIPFKVFENTNAFFNTLQIGDTVYFNGQYFTYQGLNDPAMSGEDCPTDPVFVWIPDQVTCEQDGVAIQTGIINGLSSPRVLAYRPQNGRMFVGDIDNPAGNAYWFNPVTATTSAAMNVVPGFNAMCYQVVHDPLYDRLLFTGRDTGGLWALDMSTLTWSQTAFGSNGVDFNRMLLQPLGNRIYCSEVKTAESIYILDRATLALLSTVPLSGIPGGSTNFSDFFLTRVNNELWVGSGFTTNGNIVRYNLTLSTIIGTITLPGIITEASSRYRQSHFLDEVNDRYYVADGGSSRLFIIDTTDNSIIDIEENYNRQGRQHSGAGMVLDPVNGTLYEARFHYDAINVNVLRRLYKRTRTGTLQRTEIVLDRGFGNLVHQIGTSNLWGAVEGLPQWVGGSLWNNDGQIIKYSF